MTMVRHLKDLPGFQMSRVLSDKHKTCAAGHFAMSGGDHNVWRDQSSATAPCVIRRTNDDTVRELVARVGRAAAGDEKVARRRDVSIHQLPRVVGILWVGIP